MSRTDFTNEESRDKTAYVFMPTGFGTIVDYGFNFSKNSSKYEITLIILCDRGLNMYHMEKSTYTLFNSKPRI